MFFFIQYVSTSPSFAGCYVGQILVLIPFKLQILVFTPSRFHRITTFSKCVCRFATSQAPQQYLLHQQCLGSFPTNPILSTIFHSSLIYTFSNHLTIFILNTNNYYYQLFILNNYYFTPIIDKNGQCGKNPISKYNTNLTSTTFQNTSLSHFFLMLYIR